MKNSVINGKIDVTYSVMNVKIDPKIGVDLYILVTGRWNNVQSSKLNLFGDFYG